MFSNGYNLWSKSHLTPTPKIKNSVRNIIQFIIKMLSENRDRLFNETLQGRLILLTKTGSAIAKIQDTRPIVVQNLCTRIIEKAIKHELENCEGCLNFKIGRYQWGFQRWNSTMVNILRAKTFILNHKRCKIKPILFAMDIEGAFDNISRELILKAVQKKIENPKWCRKCKVIWAFATQLLKRVNWSMMTVKLPFKHQRVHLKVVD